MSESPTQSKNENENSPLTTEGTQGPVSEIDTESVSAGTACEDQSPPQPEEHTPGYESKEGSPDDTSEAVKASVPSPEIPSGDGIQPDKHTPGSPALLDADGESTERDPEPETKEGPATSDDVNIVYAGSASSGNGTDAESSAAAMPMSENQSLSDEVTSEPANAVAEPSAEAANQCQSDEAASDSVASPDEDEKDFTAHAVSEVEVDPTSPTMSGDESLLRSDEPASVLPDPSNEGMEDTAAITENESTEEPADVVSEADMTSALSDDTESALEVSAEQGDKDSDASVTSDVQDTSGLSEELEEEHFEPHTEDQGLGKGIAHVMGNDLYHVVASLPRGYYKALRARGEHHVILTAQPLDSLWVEDDHPLQHPRLPSILYAGEDGVALDEVKGDPVSRGLPLHEAVSLLNGVALLLRFLSVKGLAVTDIDLSGLVRTADGVRLQYLPTLARMDQPAQVTFGDGTPLEGSATESATEATSMFLWGAMLFALVTGENLPAEGLDRQILSQMKTPGLPQLLNAAMRDRSACPDLRALREICQAFQRPPSPKYQIGAASTIGLNPSRLCNEDSYGLDHHAWEYHDQPWQCLRACVADGMGGEAAGEIASQAAVNAFCQHMAPDRLERPDVQVQWTRELGWEANKAVRKAVGDAGGGCTLTGIVVVNDRLALAHVGDSRAYLHSARKGLELLSRDHSLVRALLDSGNMSEDEAATSSLINQVTRALGQPMPEDYVDTLAHLVDAKGQSIREAHLTLEIGDRVLLMSDGIWGVWEYRDSVITEELTKIIDAADAAGPDPQALADALIQCALDAGADDNATVVVVARVA